MGIKCPSIPKYRQMRKNRAPKKEKISKQWVKWLIPKASRSEPDDITENVDV